MDRWASRGESAECARRRDALPGKICNDSGKACCQPDRAESQSRRDMRSREGASPWRNRREAVATGRSSPAASSPANRGSPAWSRSSPSTPPGPGEALVRILASGVCHTDLSAKNGVFGTEGFPVPARPRGRGRRRAVGEGVTNVAPGDHVILAWRAPCGECRFCLAGQPHLCAASLNAEKRMRTMDGITLNADPRHRHLLHPHARPQQAVHPVRSGAAAGADESDRLRRDDRRRRGALLRRGEAGHVGGGLRLRRRRRLGHHGRRLAGATTIIGVDIDPRKLEWAREFGATHTVNPTEGDPVEAIKAITGGYGVNYSFEAVGRPDTTDAGDLQPRPGRHLRHHRRGRARVRR